jgi:GT2 family glycosyltransferase
MPRGAASSAPSPVVSVVIPTRNCLAYLPAALASVESQAVADIEVIVVDDGSNDGTADWLEARRQAAPWLTVLCARGGGPNAARNLGIATARASLVAFLDADDVWLTGKLRPQLAFHAADPEAILSFTNYRMVDPTGRNHGTCFDCLPGFCRVATAGVVGGGYLRLEQAHARLLAANMISTSTVVARRDALQNACGFDTGLRSAADWDLWLRLARAGPVAFTPALGTQHLIGRSGSVSADTRLRIACMRRIVAAHAPAVMAGPRGAAAVRQARSQILLTEVQMAQSEGRHWGAAAARLAALRHAPSGHLVRAFAGDLLRAAARWQRRSGRRAETA